MGHRRGLLKVTANCSPPHHKLPVHHPRFRLHVYDVRAGGELVDVEGAAHIVHGEDGEELTLHVSDGDGLHGELLLALEIVAEKMRVFAEVL